MPVAKVVHGNNRRPLRGSRACDVSHPQDMTGLINIREQSGIRETIIRCNDFTITRGKDLYIS